MNKFTNKVPNLKKHTKNFIEMIMNPSVLTLQRKFLTLIYNFQYFNFFNYSYRYRQTKKKMHTKTTRIVLRYPLHYLQAMHLSGAQAFQQFSALFLPSMRIFNVVDDIYIWILYATVWRKCKCYARNWMTKKFINFIDRSVGTLCASSVKIFLRQYDFWVHIHNHRRKKAILSSLCNVKSRRTRALMFSVDLILEWVTVVNCLV